MSASLVQLRKAAVAVKVETTIGTDVIAGTPAADDWLAADCDIALNPITIDDPSYTGSLDLAPSSVGGFRPTLTLRTMFRGSGTAGTEPRLGKLLKACTMVVSNTAAAVGAPTAATAGTTTTATAQSPFGTTADQYVGMPLIITGDQDFITGITDYTTGRVATIGETRTAALTTSSLLQIPINDRYYPSSDDTAYKSVTIYVFKDGLRWKFTGCQGTWSLELTAGGSGIFTFQMFGKLAADPDATALPAGAATALAALPAAPRWVLGRSQFNKTLARMRSLSLTMGVSVTHPDNPEADYGFDNAVAISRRIEGAIDPLMDTSTYVAIHTLWEAGTDANLIAILGSAAGNRMLVTVPAARIIDRGMGNRDGLGADAIRFHTNEPDRGCFLCFF